MKVCCCWCCCTWSPEAKFKRCAKSAASSSCCEEFIVPSARPAISTPGDLALHCGKVSGFELVNSGFPFLRVHSCVLVPKRWEIETPGCCSGKNRSGEQAEASGAWNGVEEVVELLGVRDGNRTCTFKRKAMRARASRLIDLSCCASE
jgi:hypothetical protein